ncbi:MAG TPA: LLM class flavin-dependent oxidoreductase [Chloroflexota bacterium]|nr:LLM class flavin-dependent oxidoreductase [Chloroflexota bacterium]
MKFGIFSLPTYIPEYDGTVTNFYKRLLDLLVLSEELGFDSAWLNEHHFHPFGGMIPHPPVALAAVAARTKRLRLGTSISILPLHNPIETAESYAMLDQISEGRLEFGVGRGYLKHDYDVLGVDWDEGHERMFEALQVVLEAWQRQPFSFHGRFYHFDNVAVWPQPVQQPHPPIWGAATRTADSFEWFGTHGFDLLTLMHLKPMDEQARFVQVYREAAIASGRDPGSIRVGTHYQVYCAENRDEAIREFVAAHNLTHHEFRSARQHSGATVAVSEALPPEQMIEEGRVCVGRPDDCIRVIKQARDTIGLTGVDSSFYFGTIDYEKARRSLELFAAEVMPALKEPEPALV